MASSFLGIDLSTQSLKAIILSPGIRLIHEEVVTFDRDLPHYATKGGAITGAPGEVTSPVAMWLEAFDLLMQRMKDNHVDFSTIRAVSGAAQQHGSVYWSEQGIQRLPHLDPAQSLHDQLVPDAFTLPNAPIWQDSSTTAYCLALQSAVGGEQSLADLSGSRAYERFTGPQIAKIRRTSPDVYTNTPRISLISSWAASLFLGDIAPIELADASGMNLLNILTFKWEDTLLQACGGPTLRDKLGPDPVPGGTVLGPISPWWVHRWGFSPDCIVAPFTGDNPASVAALASNPGDAILSLGTSTTFLLAIPPSETPPKRLTTSHLLAHATPPGYIAMLCYKNGALAREQVRDTYCAGSWEVFDQHVRETPPGNDGHIGLYFPLQEIIPPNVQGSFFFRHHEPPERDERFPETRHARAILESQFLSIKRRIGMILPEGAPPLKRLIITGGSSQNEGIRQLAADVLGMKVFVAETKESAGWGAAMLAMWAKEMAGRGRSFAEMTRDEEEGQTEERLSEVATPREEERRVYEKMVGLYAECEDWVVKNGETV